MIPVQDRFHLYLLIGQSNMAGRGILPPAPQRTNARILVLNKNNEWAVARHPLHFDKAMAGVGLGLSFAETMLAAEKDDKVAIGLIPCAVGGTPLKRWQKDGDLYAQALARASIAMKQGTLRGILWHQGENDSASEADANLYATRLAQMIADFRADLGGGEIPFVVGKLCPSFEQLPEYPFANTVNEALAGVAGNVPRTACADSNGLGHKGDATHFTSEALVEFGKRYAVEMRKLSA